jgi:microcystin synthetase protein McyA
MHDIQAAHLPVDSIADIASDNHWATITTTLSVEDSRALMTETSHAYRTLVTDLLITALAMAYSSWTGRNTLQVDLEGHGREALFPEVDLSLTVGNFSSVYPFLIDYGESIDPVEKLVAVKEQLRKIPNGGIGYGVLRYLSPNETVTQNLQALPQSKVRFQYVGQLDQLLGRESVFKPVDGLAYPRQVYMENSPYQMDITASIVQGQLRIDWSYRTEAYSRSTVQNLVNGYRDALLRLIVCCKSTNARRYTPSDFPEANLSQQELDNLLNEIDGIEE